MRRLLSLFVGDKVAQPRDIDSLGAPPLPLLDQPVAALVPVPSAARVHMAEQAVLGAERGGSNEEFRIGVRNRAGRDKGNRA